MNNELLTTLDYFVGRLIEDGLRNYNCERTALGALKSGIGVYGGQTYPILQYLRITWQSGCRVSLVGRINESDFEYPQAAVIASAHKYWDAKYGKPKQAQVSQLSLF